MTTLSDAIAAIKAGRRDEARVMLMRLLADDGNNGTALLWMTEVATTPDERRKYLKRILAIDPTNASARRGLELLNKADELPPWMATGEPPAPQVSITQPVAKAGTVLKCPSCGSDMGSPDYTGVMQCKYCGTTITYHPPAAKVDSQKVEQFLELCKSAIDAGNYEDAFQYANKTLEIDPKSFNGWVYKAISAFWLTTVANNRYAESVEYLQKAEQIEPNNPLLRETRESLRKSQSWWYQHLGEEQVKAGRKIFEIYATQYDLTGLLTDSLLGNPDAREHSREYFVNAMNYFLLAANYESENYAALYSIRNLANQAKWINWTSDVRDRIALLHRMEEKDKAINSLPSLRKQLTDARVTLAKLKKERGFLSGVKIDNINKKINSLAEEIAQCERIANKDLS